MSAAVVDSGIAALDPLQIWNTALRNLRILENCTARLQKIASEPTQEELQERQDWEEEQLRATLDAIEGIQRQQCAGVQRALSQYTETSLVAPYPHNADALNSNREDFWQQVFTDLFPFGECREKDLRRRQTKSVLDNKR